MKIYKNTEYPKIPEGEHHSVDVITKDIDGMLNIAYYDYESKRWRFHADTLSDPYDNGKLIEFTWIYDSFDAKDLYEDLLKEQEEVVLSPIRFNGVHINKIKQVLEDHGFNIDSKF